MKPTRTLTLTLIAAATALGSVAFAQSGDDAPGGATRGFDFAMFDTDADGRITPEELSAARTARAARADSNADGMMSAAELVAADIAEATVRADARAARQIERLDANGDEQLSVAEFATRPMPMPMFERVDTDGDGAITKAEADAAMKKMADGPGRAGRHHGAPRG